MGVVRKISKGFLIIGGFLCRVVSYKWGGFKHQMRSEISAGNLGTFLLSGPFKFGQFWNAFRLLKAAGLGRVE